MRVISTIEKMHTRRRRSAAQQLIGVSELVRFRVALLSKVLAAKRRQEEAGHRIPQRCMESCHNKRREVMLLQFIRGTGFTHAETCHPSLILAAPTARSCPRINNTLPGAQCAPVLPQKSLGTAVE